ncbi:hypothetical protein BGZ75_006594 [Mortierella antarctica]|nr:hypothetical protein BGZ75_006594 [Mortierella antarctica]
MAILNYIKSSPSKNKVAAHSSDESGNQSAKAARSKNHAKKDTAKTKTVPEFRVSAMAYAISRVRCRSGSERICATVYERLIARAMAEVLYEGPKAAAEACLLEDWILRLEEIHSRDMDDRGLLLDAAESAEADFLLGTDLEALEKMVIVIACLLGVDRERWEVVSGLKIKS